MSPRLLAAGNATVTTAYREPQSDPTLVDITVNPDQYADRIGPD